MIPYAWRRRTGWRRWLIFVAQQFPAENVLLIDSGSTTTDIVYLNHGRPEPRGWTDRERLATGELVYTGLRRTPICAVLGMAVAAEFFATMLDAYVFTEDWPDNPDDCDTADGRPATRAFARARMARMRCADVETFSAEAGMATGRARVANATARAFARDESRDDGAAGAAHRRVRIGRDPGPRFA